MLLKVLFVIVLLGPLALLAPLESLKKVTGVAPAKVTFEKLLRLYVIEEPLTEESPPADVKNETVPTPLGLLKAVTIELPLTETAPVAVMLVPVP